ncbi:MAG TPA: flagellar hook capping FlgD N-terminal domain-containing protein [Ideonella sp.]|uniref:flagellar hook assembly protein FlgD n=1 Tax=Ideonella sp. TaxID=1929293 RepID=UPI002E3672CC|nr:flagellar hook capping FlgD N-terminal domain-containing protein [Ideonella sp.]HEX5682656.1 flagellar hook capping FlgD N-terminal domain-containing protein [Ideonella sp.]
MSSIGAVGATSTNLQSSNIGMQDFLNILLTQLTYQDPLKPMDNKEFMAQLAQFTTLGQTQELNGKIDSLLSTQASMQSVGLLGKTVTFNSQQGPLTGKVDSLSWAGTTPQLAIKDIPNVGTLSGISLSDVTLIK